MQDKELWRGTAALLRSGEAAAWAGHVGAVLAGLGLVHQGLRFGYVAALGLWACLVYLHVRVRLDEELFTWLAEGSDPGSLDQFLERAGLRKRPNSPRPAAERMAGAVRLWRRLLLVLALELLSAAGGTAL
ncbi:MAG TPA: hypothetical protein VFQ91_09110 [Bryobacteraceae bacterium]|nr:hypothetical protein [Bryobacteraceae bacterium]